MNESNRPTIGLALSGASGRAITHIGLLEVLREHNIPIDYITACSSGTLVAASYACGTMEQLKTDWLKFNKKFILSLMKVDTSGTGIFKTEKFTEWGIRYTLNKKFEDVTPRLGFVCADILTGEQILLTLGDILKAEQASCAVPGLFEPVQWGTRLLVDGGLFSIVPTTQAKEMGADIVIGVDISSTRYMFTTKYLRMRKGYNFLRKSMPVRIYLRLHELIDRLLTKSVDFIFYNQSDILDESNYPQPSLFSIIGKALDISVAQNEKKHGKLADYDYLICPNVKHLGKADFQSAHEMLEEGRRAALEAIPAIKKLIENFRKDNHAPAVKLTPPLVTHKND